MLLWGHIAYAQNVTGSFMHNGLNRSYTLYIPLNYDTANTHPIVFNLHGYTSGGAQQAAMTNMNAIADTAGFIVAYPEGTLDASSQLYWNAGYGTGVDDIGFINALIDTVITNYKVNEQRVYATGISNGGIMSNTLACELNHRIAAIASVGGTMSVLQKSTCTPTNRIPMMHVHGTADSVVPYAGNTILLGVDGLITHWRTHNGLSSTFSTTPFANVNLLDGSTAELRKYDIGSAYPVHLIRVANGGHSWPGSGVIVSGTTNMDFNASLEIWKFFSQYSLVTPIAKIEDTKQHDWIVFKGANPVQKLLEWETSTKENYRLTIYNVLGTALQTEMFTRSSSRRMPVEELPKGTYFAVGTNGQKMKIFKFIKA